MNSGQAGALWSKLFMVGHGADKVVEVASTEGDLILFAANKAAVHGTDFKHGACERSAWHSFLRSLGCKTEAAPHNTGSAAAYFWYAAAGQLMASNFTRQSSLQARNHSENLLLAASALSWAVCQVLYWDMPVQRAVAELMVCQNERWEQMTCRQPYRRRRVVRESWTLLKQVLYPARTAVDIDLLLNEEVYSRLLGEFELVNANIEFGHPFQAALAREALLPLSDALRRAGVWQAVAKVMSCQHEDSSVSLCSVDDDAPTQEDLPVVLGIGLARRIALMNHSCRPNCEIDYSNNGTAIVVALRELRAGEELTISYVDEQSLPVRRRRRALWLMQAPLSAMRRYGFHCYCSRCSTERLQRRRIHRQALQGKSFGPQ
ncbi:Smyd3 [Symbiodinium sp. KB8]|nr:Smyd3 [Symbiodinium sp. KB8]